MNGGKIPGSLAAMLLATAAFLAGPVAAQRTPRPSVPLGPKVTTRDAQGREVWNAPSGNAFEVVDYDVGPFPLAPTLVWNCAYMPSICKNIMQASGGRLPTLASPWTYHFDPDNKRSGARRHSVCDDYINLNKPDGTPNCPERDQPLWTGYKKDTGESTGPVVMEIIPGGTGVDKNRLGLSYQELTFNLDGTFTESTKWKEYGAKTSCDEFPMASTIEGGVAGDGKPAASTYCAPLSVGCQRNNVQVVAPAITDQNWQGFSQSSMQRYFKHLRSVLNGDQSKTPLRGRIFKFKIATISTVDSSYSAWVESNGVTRYCFGPKLSNGGTNPGCAYELRPGLDMP
ncbi:hypothetical protein NLG97_g9 [Lecanicillium saksenae]|uniref:Uncharacterized protein n=1 Tax=Lecanicillium saksenae TaxID=468837 RepID=A0ACC1R7R2_9HYPO|nr:hypothetical protein NLG97_g9 [Lecanicillium saksenae]